MMRERIQFENQLRSDRRTNDEGQNKQRLKRIDWHIVEGLIVLLHHNRNIKKTSISLKCALGYDKCVIYLDWLEIMDLIRTKIDEYGSELISLNERGESLYQRKFKDGKIDLMRERTI